MRNEIESCRGGAEEEAGNHAENTPNLGLRAEIEGITNGNGSVSGLACAADFSTDPEQAGRTEGSGKGHRVDFAVNCHAI